MSAITLPSLDGSLLDHAEKLLASMTSVLDAANNATSLLSQAGFAGMRGDTADDLRQALVVHGHLLHQFNVTVRTLSGVTTFCTRASTASAAAERAMEQHGDDACGVTVTQTALSRIALAAAHRALKIKCSLDQALDDPSLRVAIRAVARKYPARSANTTDFKSLAANDRN